MFKMLNAPATTNEETEAIWDDPGLTYEEVIDLLDSRTAMEQLEAMMEEEI